MITTNEDIEVVREWLYENSQRFTIPGGEWGISLYNAIARMHEDFEKMELAK